jgi:hypothetical protein
MEFLFIVIIYSSFYFSYSYVIIIFIVHYYYNSLNVLLFLIYSIFNNNRYRAFFTFHIYSNYIYNCIIVKICKIIYLFLIILFLSEIEQYIIYRRHLLKYFI